MEKKNDKQQYNNEWQQSIYITINKTEEIKNQKKKLYGNGIELQKINVIY